MENASKALIMAGAILISLIVISFGIIVFRNMSSSVQNNTDLDQQTIDAFNSRLTKYIGNNVSGSQVNALIQVVRTIDQKAVNEQDGIRRITVQGKGTVTISDDGKVTYTNVQTGKYYTVTATYGDYGLINNIAIAEK